jgi:hypothetical protein
MFGFGRLFHKKEDTIKDVVVGSRKKNFRIHVRHCASPMIVFLNFGERFKVVDSNVKKTYNIGRVISREELMMNLLASGVGVAVLPNDRMKEGAWKK